MDTHLRLLTHTNLQRLLEAIGVVYQPVRPQQLPVHFATVLGELIPGEFHAASIVFRPRNGFDPGRRDTTICPIPEHWESLAEVFAGQYGQFPLRPIRESGNLHQALAISDVESRQKLEQLDLYQDYYRVLGVEDDLSVNFGNPNHRVCLAVLRGRRGFSDQDRAMLSVLRIHMERAYVYAGSLQSPQRATETGAASQPVPANCQVEDRGDSLRLLCSLGLSEREAEVLYWVAAGKSSPVISAILGIRHDTVRAHLKRIYAKMGVENRLSAALRALQVLQPERL